MQIWNELPELWLFPLWLFWCHLSWLIWFDHKGFWCSFAEMGYEIVRICNQIFSTCLQSTFKKSQITLKWTIDWAAASAAATDNNCKMFVPWTGSPLPHKEQPNASFRFILICFIGLTLLVYFGVAIFFTMHNLWYFVFGLIFILNMRAPFDCLYFLLYIFHLFGWRMLLVVRKIGFIRRSRYLFCCLESVVESISWWFWIYM